jgi:hypothetical protein
VQQTTELGVIDIAQAEVLYGSGAYEVLEDADTLSKSELAAVVKADFACAHLAVAGCGERLRVATPAPRRPFRTRGRLRHRRCRAHSGRSGVSLASVLLDGTDGSGRRAGR